VKLRLGTLREILIEYVYLKPEADGKAWDLVTKPIDLGHVDSPAIDQSPGGFAKAGIWTVAKVARRFPKDYVDDGVVPQGATPDDVLLALKTGQAQKTPGGLLVPPPGLQDVVTDMMAEKAAKHLRSKGVRPDIVTTPQSSSALGHMFAEKIASALGARYVKFGLLKQQDPDKIDVEVPPSYSPESEKKLRYNLDRARRKIKQQGTFSMRNAFHARERKLVRNFLEPSDEMMDIATDPSRSNKLSVLVVDDVVTTGSTQEEAKRKLLELDFNVIGAVAMFKEPE